MKTLATFSALDQATALLAFLTKEQIPYQTRDATEEGTGLDVTEVLVEDDQYDLACGAVEKWEAALQAASAAQPQRRCPECRSPISSS